MSLMAVRGKPGAAPAECAFGCQCCCACEWVAAATAAGSGERSGGQGRVHHTNRLVRTETRIGVCHLVAKSLFAVGDPVGKDHADRFVQVVASL